MYYNIKFGFYIISTMDFQKAVSIYGMIKSWQLKTRGSSDVVVSKITQTPYGEIEEIVDVENVIETWREIIEKVQR